MPELEYAIPETRGGLTAVPGLDCALDYIRHNTRGRDGWEFAVGEVGGRELAAAARGSAIGAARDYCADRSIAFDDRGGPCIVTGHQPVFFHPGVWAKNFVVDGLGSRLGGTALNLVVDSDAGDTSFEVPSWDGRRLQTSRRRLTSSPPDVPFESVAPPGAPDVEKLCRDVLDDLMTLADPIASRNFERFAAAMRNAQAARDLGDFLTRTRRTHEAGAGTVYGELPVTRLCATDEFLTFFLSVAEQVETFRDVYNASLAAYRAKHEVRSAANPFPDLAVDGDLVETPFWLMDGKGLRATLWLKRKGELSMVCHANGCKVELVRGRYGDNIAVLRRERIEIRPKALVLTLYARMFLSDLFVHGVGGAKYDRVTDEIIRRFYGVEPPRYISATATLWLPMGVEMPKGRTAAELKQRLHALEHNPDRFASDPELSAQVRPRVAELAGEKAALVAAIGRDGAEKKVLGAKIRDLNASLAELLEPVCRRTQQEIAEAERADESRQIAQYRDFPYCYWSASEVRSLTEEALDAAAAPIER